MSKIIFQCIYISATNTLVLPKGLTIRDADVLFGEKVVAYLSTNTKHKVMLFNTKPKRYKFTYNGKQKLSFDAILTWSQGKEDVEKLRKNCTIFPKYFLGEEVMYKSWVGWEKPVKRVITAICGGNVYNISQESGYPKTYQGVHAQMLRKIEP